MTNTGELQLAGKENKRGDGASFSEFDSGVSELDLTLSVPEPFDTVNTSGAPSGTASLISRSITSASTCADLSVQDSNTVCRSLFSTDSVIATDSLNSPISLTTSSLVSSASSEIIPSQFSLSIGTTNTAELQPTGKENKREVGASFPELDSGVSELDLTGFSNVDLFSDSFNSTVVSNTVFEDSDSISTPSVSEGHHNTLDDTQSESASISTNENNDQQEQDSTSSLVQTIASSIYSFGRRLNSMTSCLFNLTWRCGHSKTIILYLSCFFIHVWNWPGAPLR